MRKFGIDLSHWNDGLDLQKAQKEFGVEFAIIKAGGGECGRYKDSKFEKFYARAKELGMPVGAYYFGGARTVVDAEIEANHFLELLKGKQFEYPVWYDVEGYMLELDSETLTQIIERFCAIVEKAGYWVGYYSSTWYINNQILDGRLKRYSHWVADWSVKEPPVLNAGSETQMWQFGGEDNATQSPIICGMVVDQNYCYVDYPTAIKGKCLNGFGAPGPSNVEKPVTPQKPVEVKPTDNFVVGAKVTVKAGAKDANLGVRFADFVYKTTYKIVRVDSDNYVVIGADANNIVGAVKKADLLLAGKTEEVKPTVKKLEVGTNVMVKPGSKHVTNGAMFADFVYKTTYKVIRIDSDDYVVFGNSTSDIIGAVKKTELIIK